ncbi:TPA: hypothetical protein N0F65_002699 [Lagenidium giganteum]|uniref:Fe2OG dioxygenase domain-containing protein n=1 Tax=Lagenidium giganteum TaxID=4803 RepID=A0AAV2Z228_9STRA|nr:TPA: hypothetical protein N0F65_002699 [Lagenidium giganteum]
MQVSQLQSQVQVLALAKDQAQQEYKQAQRALDRVAKDADRALLGLTTTATGAAVAPAPVNGQTTRRTGDDLLPELPHDAILALAGTQLATQHYAVVDGFVGKELSLRALSDIVHLYPTDDQPVFRMGELAGGHTGRNVRYQMEHVRGDYVLWVDEHDEYCPVSIKQMLRQIDRVVLERLQRWNDELSASALLRNKTMITCYPGNGARYTKHCDNPNQNGRKLTAIVYLNPEWEPTHGGELRLHTDNTTNVPLCVAPLLDRLLLFFSDRRVPHEVLPCFTNRYALTVWYLDYDEFMNAQVFGDMTHDAVEEEERIQQEIKSFAARAASKA